MKVNMGKTDRLLRGIVGVVIIAAGFYYESWWGAIGLVPLLTAVISFCPAYVPMKMDTRKSDEK